MKKENNKQQKDCPFCEISQEAVDNLKSNLDSKDDSETKEKTLPFKSRTVFWFLLLLIIGILVGVIFFL